MDWQATDQFGNLFIGESSSTDVESLRPELASLIEQLAERAGDSFRVVVDFSYNEICGPDPEHVSHLLRVPWLSGSDRDATFDAVRAAVDSACGTLGSMDVRVDRA